MCVSTAPPPDIGKGFDSEIGLRYIEVTPDGGSAQLEIHDKLLQPWGIMHGGVYCSIVESLASVSGHVWLSENGGGTVVGVNNNTDFLRAISSGTRDGGVDADTSGQAPAAVADHHHRRQRTASSRAARCGCRTSRRSSAQSACAAERARPVAGSPHYAS